jgi:hypothetical protein
MLRYFYFLASQKYRISMHEQQLNTNWGQMSLKHVGERNKINNRIKRRRLSS